MFCHPSEINDFIPIRNEFNDLSWSPKHTQINDVTVFTMVMTLADYDDKRSWLLVLLIGAS